MEESIFVSDAYQAEIGILYVHPRLNHSPVEKNLRLTQKYPTAISYVGNFLVGSVWLNQNHDINMISGSKNARM